MGRGTKQKRKAARADERDKDNAPARVSESVVVQAEDRTGSRGEATPLLPPQMELWLHQNGTVLGICLFLVAATVAVYGQTVGFEFVTYDDNQYIFENPHVKKGLSFEGIQWAFTHVHSANWHPLTTISHMLDCSLYGTWAGGHHLTNVLLHALASVILFLALRRMTGAVWLSGIVAAFFCLHPLHVESVAWVSERKDVLSGVFFGLTLWAYTVYAEDVSAVLGKPSLPAADGTPSESNAWERFPWARYGLVLGLFVLGLLAKPMLVTLPFLLMLLDYWPLRRWDVTEHVDAEGMVIKTRPLYGVLLLEKLPMLALSAASSVATYCVQSSAGAVTETVEPLMRMQTAIVGYGRYLVMLFWPFNLSMRYPPDSKLDVKMIVLCLLSITILSVVFWLWSRRGGRYALVGWLWFLGMIVPVSGIVVIGEQSMADRYSYLTYTGLFIVLVWGAAELGAKRAGGWIAGILLALCAGLSILQAGVWRNSEALYRQALAVRPDDFMAHSNLGKVLENRGKSEEAEKEFHQALDIEPRDFQAHNSLGVMERRRGNLQAAKDHYIAALTVRPNFALAHNNLAVAYFEMGLTAEAEQECLLALKFDPDLADAENNLGNALAGRNQWKEAIPHYRHAIEIDPDRAQDHLNLAIALFGQRSFEEGLAECKRALELEPDNIDAHHELAKMYHSLGKLPEAFGEWKLVLERQPGNAAACKGMGMVLVKGGHGADAIPYLQTAVAVAPRDLESRQFKLVAHLAAKQIPEALAEFREIHRQDPKNQKVLADLAHAVTEMPKDVSIREFRANVLIETRQIEEAAKEFREVLKLEPKNLDALNGLAWIEAAHPDAKLRNGKEAVNFAEEADKLQKDDAPTLDTLAAAYAEAGRYKDAVATARKAKDAAEKIKALPLIKSIDERLKLYEAGKPYRDMSMTGK